MASWFQDLNKNLANALDQVKEQAQKLTEDATPLLGTAVNAVKEQAAKFKDDAVQAAEAIKKAAVDANNEILQEQERVKWAADPHSAADHLVTILPWEAEEEAKSILSQPLMEQILALSLDETNFQLLDDEERAQFPFKLENYVDVVMRLLELDPNLGKVHNKVGSKLPEEELWRAYFYRCACQRAEIGMAGVHDYIIIGDPIPRKPKVIAEATPPASISPSAEKEGKVGSIIKGSSSSLSKAKKEKKGGGKSSPSKASPSKKGGSAERGLGSSIESPGKGSGGSSKKGGGVGEEGAATVEESVPAKKEEEDGKGVVEVEEDDDDLDLEGLDMSDDDGALEGEALEALEAQIAAELDEDI